jgi:hypothetical protein
MQAVYFLLGIVLLIVEAYFGRNEAKVWSSGPTRVNAAHGGAACGFGVAGGLCFLASAMVQRGNRRQE